MPPWTPPARGLPYWALEAFQRRCHLWRPDRVVTAGIPGDESYGDPYLMDVPYDKRPARTGERAQVFGQVEGDNILTLDLVFFPDNVPVGADWWMQDVTLLPDGSPASKYGAFYAVRGDISDWESDAVNEGGVHRCPAILERDPHLTMTGYVVV